MCWHSPVACNFGHILRQLVRRLRYHETFRKFLNARRSYLRSSPSPTSSRKSLRSFVINPIRITWYSSLMCCSQKVTDGSALVVGVRLWWSSRKLWRKADKKPNHFCKLILDINAFCDDKSLWRQFWSIGGSYVKTSRTYANCAMYELPPTLPQKRGLSM